VDIVKLRDSCRFALRGVNHLLWPAVCISCRKSICETDNNLCKDCWEQLLSFAEAESECVRFAVGNGG